MDTSELDRVIEQYHHALDEFVRGNPEPQKERFSHRDDVSLANPLRPAVVGWTQVEQTMDRAAALFEDGEPTDFERIASGVTPDLAFIVENERATTRMRGRPEPVCVALRVTTIFRPEDGTWKVVHRHADTITAPRPPETLLQQ